MLYTEWDSHDRRFARQLLQGGHVLVNGRKVNIPSYLVKEGDRIEIREKSKNNVQIQRALELSKQTGIAQWVDVDKINW